MFHAEGKPVVVVINSGSVIETASWRDRVDAIVLAWEPGEEAGNAIADVLTGKVCPSGKLTMTWPISVYDHASSRHFPSRNKVSNHEEDIYVGYRYFDTFGKDVSYPFGYGMSYTTFEYSNLQLASEVPTSAEAVDITFEVKNTGKMAADEIAQIYLSPTDAQQPIRPLQLQGFTRITLAPGESKTVHAKLFTEQFGYFSHQGQRQWNVAPGKYVVKVASSSADIKLQEPVTLTGEPVSKPIRDHYFSLCTVK